MAVAAVGKAALSLFAKNLKKLADTGDEWATGQLRRLGALGNKNVKTQGTAREIGRGSPGSIVVKEGNKTRMARGAATALKKKLKNEQRALTKSGALKAGGAATGVTVVETGRRFLSDDDDATTDQMKKDQKVLDEIAAQAAKDAKKGSGSGKGSGKSTGSKTESKTFRERRLARMKKRLEGADSEGRKRRLKKRITRVEGRIEDSKKKPVKKNMGGMMKSKMASKGGVMKKKGYASGGAVKSTKKRSSGAALRGFGAEMR